MSFKAKYEKIKSDYLIKLSNAQLVVNASIKLTDEDDNVKLLTVGSTSKILTIESLGGAVKVNGSVSWKALYVLSNGEIKSVDYLSDFTDTLDVEGVNPSMRLLAQSNVLEIKTEVADNNIFITAVLDIGMQAVASYEYDCLADADDAYVKGVEEQFIALSAMGEGSFEISEDVDINGKLERVLYYDSKVVIKDASVGEGLVIISGEVVSEVTIELDRGIETRFYCMPFQEDIMAQGAQTGYEVYCEAIVKSNKIVISQENNKTIIGLEAIIFAKAAIFSKKYYTLVSDIYSPNYNINVKREEVSAERLVFSKYYEEKINGLAQLNEDMPSIQTILTTCVSNNVVTNISADDNYVVAEGLLTATVIYKDYENQVNSVKVELPYSLKKSIMEARKTQVLTGKIVENAVSSRIRRDKEIEVYADLKICIDAFESYKINYVSDCVKGEDKQVDATAISIYVAEEGETFWDIGKALNASVDTIKLLNPNLSEPLTGKERITIYRKRNIDDSIM